MFSDAHGGLDWDELRKAGLTPGEVIDFSVNTNPFGPPPGVLAALAGCDLTAYPDREVLALREGLARCNQIGLDQVLVGNGAAELIWLAARALLSPGDRVLVVGPTFGEYARASAACGAQVIEFRAQPPDFNLDLDALLEQIRRENPRLVFLCNPNNPTGLLLSENNIQDLASACAPGVLVLDEAYRAFVTGHPFAPPLREDILVLRSMTKDFAIAGLRLGYALGPRLLITAMKQVQPPWSVNAAAQVAGIACLGGLETVCNTLLQTRQLAGDLSAELARAGVKVAPSSLHYRLVDVQPFSGEELRRKLLEHRLVVRDCASFGLPGYVRAGTRLGSQNAQLLEAWRLLI